MKRPTCTFFVIDSTTEAGRLSFRLQLGDPTATPVLRAIKAAGFKAGDRVKLALAPAPRRRK